MKKSIFGLGMFLALAIYFLVQKTPSKIEEVQPSIVNKPLKTKETSPSLKELAKRKIDTKLPSIKDTALHPCHKIIDSLVDNSFEEIKENTEDLYDHLRNANCKKALEPVLKNNPELLGLEKKCLANNSLECDSLLFFLKTWAVSLKYPDSIDISDLDETILANKLMYNFTANPALPPEVLNQNLKILDEIISKNPSSYGAQKAKLIHLFAKEFQNNADVEEEFQNTLDSMNSLKSDPEVEEMLVVKPFIKQNRSSEKILEKINNFMEKYPQSPKGPYYRAALEWNLMQNPKETKNWLEKAKSLDPRDAAVLNSLENLKRAKLGEPIFYFTFHFDLEEV